MKETLSRQLASTRESQETFSAFCQPETEETVRHAGQRRARTAGQIVVIVSLSEGHMSFQQTSVELFPAVPQGVVQSPLARKLWALRAQAIKEGTPLLTAEEVLVEVKRRRGELEKDDA